MLGQKLLLAATDPRPVDIVASETFVDTDNRTLYTFNGTLDAGPGEVVVGLMAVHSSTGTSKPPIAKVGGDNAILVERRASFSLRCGTALGYKFGPIDNPVSQIGTLIEDDNGNDVVAREAASTHVILSGVKNVPWGSEYRADGTNNGQQALFNLTGIADSIVLAIAAQSGTGNISWSGAMPLVSQVYGDARMSVAYVIGDGSNVSFSATTTGEPKAFGAVAATFAP